MKSDLKIIDELLCLFKGDKSWDEFRSLYNLTEEAITRLEQAWANNEMEAITLSLARHFKNE